MTDIADLRITTDTKPLENLILKLKELAAQGKVTQQVLASIKVPNIPRGGGVYITPGPRGGSGGPNVGPMPIPGMAPRSSGTSPAGRRAGITGGGFGQAFTTGNNSFADRMREAAKAAQLLQGPLGGVAARLVTLANVIENFNAVSALMSIATLAVAGTLLVFAGNAVMLGDKMVMLHGRVRTIVGDMGSAEGSFKSIANIAKDTGNQLETVVDVYNRISLGAKNLGKTNAEILNVTSLATKTGVLSGTTPGAQQNALLQFGQAVGAGTVHAEEFNSLLENMPKLADEIAKGMGTTAAHLRQMVIQGKVLSKDIFESLQKRTLDINAEFEKMSRTITRTISEFQVEMAQIVDDFNRNLGVSEALADVLKGVVKITKDIGSNVGNIIAIIKGVGVGASITAVLVGLTKIPVVLTATGSVISTLILGWRVYTGQAVLATAASLAVADALKVISSLGIVVLLTAIGIAASVVATNYFKLEEAAKRADAAHGDFEAALLKNTKAQIDAAATTIQTAKAYDKFRDQYSKTKDGQEKLRINFMLVANSMEITTARLQELTKKYGSVTDAVYALIAAKELEARQQMAQDKLDKANKAWWDYHNPASDSFWGKDPANAGKKLNEIESSIRQAESERYAINKVDSDSYAKKQLENIRKLAELAGTLVNNPAADEKRDPFKEYLNDLRAEIAYQSALNKELDKGEKAYRANKNAFEALMEVRKRNLKAAPPGSDNEKLLVGLKKGALDLKDLNAAKLAAETKDKENFQLNFERTKAAVSPLKEFESRRAVAIAKELGRLTGGNDALNEVRIPSTTGMKKPISQVAAESVDIPMYKDRDAYVRSLDEELKYRNAISAAVASGSLNAKAWAEQDKQYSMLKDELVRKYGDEKMAVEQIVKLKEADRKEAEAPFLGQVERTTENLKRQNEALQEGYQWDQTRQAFILPALEKWNRELEVRNQLGDAWNSVSDETKAKMEQQIAVQQTLNATAQQQESILRFQQQALAQLGDSMANSLVDALNGGKSSFHDFAMSVLRDLEMMILKAFIFNKIFGGTNPFTGQQQQGFLSKFLPMAGSAIGAANPAIGGAITAAGLISKLGGYAKGDAFADGAKVGVFGENGPEAILPLRRGGDGKLGVVASGGGGGGDINIHNTISVNANGGTKEQNADLAQKIGKEIDGRMKEMVTQQIAEQMRSGNMLNRKRTI